MSSELLESQALTQTPPERRSIFEVLEDPHATSVLPSLESILKELNALTRRASAHIDEITQLVRLDQSLSLQVLRIANSAYYGPPTPVADVPSALMYIGLSTLRGALVSTRCMEKTCTIPQEVFDWKEFWVHATGVGHITSELATHLRDPMLPAESFYLMGQFHDIGKVVLACLMPQEFTEIYTRAANERIPLAGLEVETLGVEHGHLGAWYMEKQGIPLTIREPVRFHHSGMIEDDKPHFLHAALIRLADHFAHNAELGQSGNVAPMGDPFESPDWAWYLAHCDPERATHEEIKETLTTQIEKISHLVRDIIA